MKTIGSVLKEERVKKNLSLKQLEKETKIKKVFIDFIEKGEWENLPEYPAVLGFVKTIAKSLNLSDESAAAILRRDYPFDKKKVILNPKPDLNLKPSFSPKLIIAIISIFFGIVFLGYLLYQYLQYISPPLLEVRRPLESEEMTIGDLTVVGKTDEDATLKVNNQSILISDTGEFRGEIEIGENTKEIIFIAKSRYGKETIVVRNIVPKQTEK